MLGVWLIAARGAVRVRIVSAWLGALDSAQLSTRLGSKLGLAWLRIRLGLVRDLARPSSQGSAHHDSRSGPGSIRLRFARIGLLSDLVQAKARDSGLSWALFEALLGSSRLVVWLKARLSLGFDSGSLLSHLSDLDLAWCGDLHAGSGQLRLPDVSEKSDEFITCIFRVVLGIERRIGYQVKACSNIFCLSGDQPHGVT